MIYDTKTKNLSFIKMYKVLKSRGIKNNKFFLVLYDKSLQGVDPYSENLTPIQKEKIKIEIKRNIWYYLREIVRIPVPGGAKRYELHRGNLALTFCMINCFNIFLALPRQHGKTVGVVIVYSWLYYFGTENSQMLFINKELPYAQNNLKVFKGIIECLPAFIKDWIRNKKDTDNINYINSINNGNSIKVDAPAIDVSGSDKKGRGLTTPLQWWDEFAFTKHNGVMYGAAAPASSQAKIEAKNNHKYYGTTITTTPNNIDIDEGKYCKESLIDQACVFDEVMYDWTKDEILECIDKRSDNNFLYVEFSYKQLGRDEKWLRNQLRDLNNNMLLLRREVLLEWTRSSDVAVYTETQLAAIEKNLKYPTSRLCINKYWFVDIYDNGNLDYTKAYIIACDVSTGLAQDASAFTIIDPVSLNIIGEFRENKIDTKEYEELLISLVTKYFYNSIIVMENNSVGTAILDSLMRSVISSRIYYERKERIASKIQKDLKELSYSKEKQSLLIYGISTTKESRDLMLELLDDTVNNEPELLATKYIYSDIKTLERNKKGKIEHRQGCHDDSLMSYLIGRYVLAYGNNLSRFMISSKRGETYEEYAKKINRMGHKLSKFNQEDARNNFGRFTTVGRIAIEEIDLYEKNKKASLNGFSQFLKSLG